MRSALPTGTVTFLFTDVEGSTKLLHELGAEGYAEALAEHRRVIREACAAEGGVEVDTQGDAFFFAFPSAQGAVDAASSFTEALASGPLQVRVGLHTGTPLLTDEGYIGDDVHFGARVASSSHGGQVVLSSATAELVQIELSDLGEHRLKDIPQAVPIFQLGDGSFPPLKTISNTNLPRPASSFVGRDDELLEVLSRFEAGARLVTLSGPGGTGKTRLAIEAAASLVPEFKAGVFWVGLATLRDPTLVTETIGQALAAKDGLAEHIGEREMLVLLDNLEQVIDAAPELASLLERSPNLKLLVTSRELLRVRGEVEYAVPPLAEQEAVSLFCERAQGEADETIAELCRRLDNLPLAVELAAARASVLTPEQILDRLSQRLDLLKGGRDADPRQQTLRATIEWSYELLSPEEQLLFARLSTFAGGCTLEAAEEVAEADLDTLQSLVEKSLVRFTDGRYWMLETIREYAGERLEEVDELRRRHCEYFSTLAQTTDDDVASRDRLTKDHDNLRAALEWAIEHEPDRIALSFADSLVNFWIVFGFLAEAQRLLDAVLLGSDVRSEERPAVLGGAGEVAMMRREYGDARRLLGEAITLGVDVDPTSAARARNALGIVAGLEGDAADAVSHFAHAVRDAQRLGDAVLESYCHANLARAYFDMGDEDRAREALDSSARLAETHAFRRPLAFVANVRARIAVEHSDWAGALRHAGDSLAIAKEYGDRWLGAEGFEVLAVALAGTGDSKRAGIFWGVAETVREEIGSPLGLSEKRWLERCFQTTRARRSPGFDEGVCHGRSLGFEDALMLSASID